VGIQSNVLMWKSDTILPAQGADGQKPSRPQVRAQQVSAKELALGHPASRVGASAQLPGPSNPPRSGR
jgi:hypothetical protein